MLVLEEADVAHLLDLDEAIAAVEAAFAAPPVADGRLLRRRLYHGDTRLNVLGGATHSPGYLAVKAYTGGSAFAVLLFDGRDGSLLATIEARLLSLYRTAAASAVASRWLARADSTSLALLGTGYQARGQLRALARTHELDDVRVWGRTHSAAVQLCGEVADELGTRPVACRTAQEAVDGADLVVTATKATDPVLAGSWVSLGAHVNLVGANQRHRREADEELFARSAATVVDDREQAELESGELHAAIDAGILTWTDVIELHEVCAGRTPARTGPRDITVFKSLGVGLEDAAVAARVYANARSAG